MRRSTLLIEAAFVFSLIGLSPAATKESKLVAQVTSVPTAIPEPTKTHPRLVAEIPGSIYQSPAVPQEVINLMGNPKFREWRAIQNDNFGKAIEAFVFADDFPLKWTPRYNPDDSKPLEERVFPEPNPFGPLRGIIPQGESFDSQFGVEIISNTQKGPYIERFHLLTHPNGSSGFVANQLGEKVFTVRPGTTDATLNRRRFLWR